MSNVNRQGGRGANNTQGRGRGRNILQGVSNLFRRNRNQERPERPERPEQQETIQIGWEHPSNVQPTIRGNLTRYNSTHAVVGDDDAAAARAREEAQGLGHSTQTTLERSDSMMVVVDPREAARATSLGTEDDIAQRQAEHQNNILNKKTGVRREPTTSFGKKAEKAKLLKEHFDDSIKQAIELSLEEAKKAVLGVASRPAKEPSPELSKEEFIKRIRDMGFSDKIKHIEKKIKNLEKDNSDIDYNDLLNEFIDNLNNNDSASDVDKKPAAK